MAQLDARLMLYIMGLQYGWISILGNIGLLLDN